MAVARAVHVLQRAAGAGRAQGAHAGGPVGGLQVRLGPAMLNPTLMLALTLAFTFAVNVSIASP